MFGAKHVALTRYTSAGTSISLDFVISFIISFTLHFSIILQSLLLDLSFQLERFVDDTMFKRSIYTVVTPLPPTITRETAIDALHDHSGMIELNPLVTQHDRCKPPPNAPADEFHCTWYQLTDRVPYLPGIKGQVNYKACFHDLPRGLQTHVYAPAGLDIRDRWTIGGNEPGEEREIIELGLSNLGVPREGLYLREDIDMRCSVFLTNFVKKTLNKAHNVLVERLVVKADLVDDKKARDKYSRGSIMTSSTVASNTASTTGSSSVGFASPRSSGFHDRHGSVADSSTSSFTDRSSPPIIPERRRTLIHELPAPLASELVSENRDTKSPIMTTHPAFLAPPPSELP